MSTLADIDPALWAKVQAVESWPAGAMVHDSYHVRWITLAGGPGGSVEFVPVDDVAAPAPTGASGPGDSFFYTDAAGVGGTTLLSGDVTIPWNAGSVQGMGDDLALNGGDSTMIDVLTDGIYSIGMRLYVNVNTDSGPVNCRVTQYPHHPGVFAPSDISLLQPAWEQIIYAITGTANGWAINGFWVLKLSPSSYDFRAAATRLDASVGAITLHNATEILIRRVA